MPEEIINMQCIHDICVECTLEVFMCPECKKPTDLCEDTKLALAQCYNEKLEDKYKPSEVEVINEVEEELESRDNSPETEMSRKSEESKNIIARKKIGRFPLTFQDSSGLKGGRARTSQKSIKEFNFNTKDRLFPGSFSDNESAMQDKPKMISESALSDNTMTVSELNKKPRGSESSLGELIGRKLDKGSPDLRSNLYMKKNKMVGNNYSSQVPSEIGMSMAISEDQGNAWKLQRVIKCKEHRGENVMYWDGENKRLLCGNCLMRVSKNFQSNQENLRNIEKSLPYIRQTIEDSVNEVNLQQQFLKNKQGELEIRKGSLETQQKSLENKYRIEVTDFLQQCKEMRDTQMKDLKLHFKGIEGNIEEALFQVRHKEEYLDRVSKTFHGLARDEASLENTIELYCENVKDIDKELGEVRQINEKIEDLTTGGFFRQSTSEANLWYLQYLIEFYEKLGNLVFKKKTHLVGKLKKKVNIIESKKIQRFNSLKKNYNYHLPNEAQLRNDSRQHNNQDGPPVSLKDASFLHHNSSHKNYVPGSKYNNQVLESKERNLSDNRSSTLEEGAKNPPEFSEDRSEQLTKVTRKDIQKSQFYSKRNNKKNGWYHKKQNYSNPVVLSQAQKLDNFSGEFRFKNSGKKVKKDFISIQSNPIEFHMAKNISRKYGSFEDDNRQKSSSKKRNLEDNESYQANLKDSDEIRFRMNRNIEHKRHISNLEELSSHKMTPKQFQRTKPFSKQNFRGNGLNKVTPKTERPPKWKPESKSWLDNQSQKPKYQSKSSRNLLGSAFEESYRKIKADAKSRKESLMESLRERPNLEILRKREKQHKRGIRSDFGVIEKKGLFGEQYEYKKDVDLYSRINEGALQRRKKELNRKWEVQKNSKWKKGHPRVFSNYSGYSAFSNIKEKLQKNRKSDK